MLGWSGSDGKGARRESRHVAEWECTPYALEQRQRVLLRFPHLALGHAQHIAHRERDQLARRRDRIPRLVTKRVSWRRELSRGLGGGLRVDLAACLRD